MSLVAESLGEGLPIVCLPWFSLDGSVMAAALEPALLGVVGLRRIYVDLPGTGRSPGGPANSDGVVDAVDEFLDGEVGPVPILLVGASYGGYLAAALARRRPERVAGLMLICHATTIGKEHRDVDPAPAVAEDADWLVEAPSTLRAHLSVALGNRTRAATARVAAALASTGFGDDEYLERLRTTGYRLSDEDSTVPYDGPTSILAGRQDFIAGYRNQFRALGTYPDASYAALADAGHYLPFEQPEAFRSLVLDWLARCGGHP